MKELWNDIIGYEGCYQVSNYGNIKSLNRYIKHPKGGVRFIRGITLKQSFDSDGYNQVGLAVDGVQTTRKVHRIVATAFIPNPNNLPQVNHIDKNKTNNCVDNLEWSEDRENNTHACKYKIKQSRFTGVSRNQRCSTWRAAIRIKGRSIYLGSFKSEDEAGAAYISALTRYDIKNKYAVND